MYAALAPTATACTPPGAEDWALPADGALDVPTDALLLGSGFDRLGLRRADDGSDVPTTDVSRGQWWVDLDALLVVRPQEELAPDTAYVVTWDDNDAATFTTGDGPGLDPPDPPTVGSVTYERGSSAACSAAERIASFRVTGAGVLLVADVEQGDAYVDEEDPFRASGVRYERIRRRSTDVRVGLDEAGPEARFGVIDASARWSGWSDPLAVEPGCGCRTGGRLFPLAWPLVALLPSLRSRRSGSTRTRRRSG